jgi:hypothetical protein
LADWYPERAFLWVELDAVAVEVGEGFTQIVRQVICFRCLDDDIVNVDLNIATDLFLQACLHAPLIGGSGVLEPEGHCHVAVYPMWGDECCLVFVFDLQLYLVVSGVGIEEREALAARGRIDDLVDSGQREVFFRACLFNAVKSMHIL